MAGLYLLQSAIPTPQALTWMESSSAAVSLMWMRFLTELDSMRLAVLTVSPKRQKRGFMLPTTLLTTGPV
eukprot:52436-Pyramimonas_sp.AAC.1